MWMSPMTSTTAPPPHGTPALRPSASHLICFQPEKYKHVLSTAIQKHQTIKKIENI
jgi:hypothetical protein